MTSMVMAPNLGLPAPRRAVRRTWARAKVRQAVSEQRRATSECLLHAPCIMHRLKSKHCTRQDGGKAANTCKILYISPHCVYSCVLPSSTESHTLLLFTSEEYLTMPISSSKEITAMTTGVIPGSGIPSFNMTSVASHSLEPSELHCLLSIFLDLAVVIATASAMLIVVKKIGSYANAVASAATRWFKSFTKPQKPVAISTVNDDTDYTPAQNPTPTICTILSCLRSLADTVRTDHEQLGEQLSTLNNTIKRIVHQEKLRIAVEEYLKDELSHATEGPKDAGLQGFHVVCVAGPGEMEGTRLGATGKEETVDSPVSVKATIKKQSGEGGTCER
jgi:hypothetical protein